ncbi:MAG: OsmC family protein [Ignavibacteriaceae bacterium]
MQREHLYNLTVEWIGNKGTGTSAYRAYERSHTISSENKDDILCSSDPVFRGDKTRYNPEELLVAALSSCHMLSYLHLCADAGIVVVNYVDNPSGIMIESQDGSGHFTEVTLHPVVTITDTSMTSKANELHKKANELCFIANSCNFKVQHIPTCKTTEDKN